MENLTEKLKDAFNELTDSEKISLWNDYCEGNNDYDSQAIPVSELDELYPLSSFESVRNCIWMYSSVMNDTGVFNCDYATLSGNGYLIPFDVDNDIDIDEVVEAVADGDLYRSLPDELMEIMDNVEDEEEDE